MPKTLNKLDNKVTTRVMVENTLISIHKAKGVTIKEIENFILNNYGLKFLSKQRISLIKKHILSLRESEDIKNTTGAGLRGRFKLTNVRKFTVEAKRNNNIQGKSNLNRETADKIVIAKESKAIQRKNNKHQVILYSKDLKRTYLINKETILKIPMQVTPLEPRKKRK